jgi:hypothetical protein
MTVAELEANFYDHGIRVTSIQPIFQDTAWDQLLRDCGTIDKGEYHPSRTVEIVYHGALARNVR